MAKRFWRFLGVPVLLAAITITVADGLDDTDKEPQILSLDPPLFNGEAGQGEELDVTFTVRNVHDRDVTILGATQSCVCVASPRQFPMKLAPGVAGKIRFTVSAGGAGRKRISTRLIADVPGAVPVISYDIRVSPEKE